MEKQKGEKMAKKQTEEEHKGMVSVLITTDSSKRGVFSGFIDPKYMDEYEGKHVPIEEMRMCVYWSSDMKGVLGLASMGPSKSCKISKAVKKATLSGITAIIELSDEALAKWRLEPWG